MVSERTGSGSGKFWIIFGTRTDPQNLYLKIVESQNEIGIIFFFVIKNRNLNGTFIFF